MLIVFVFIISGIICTDNGDKIFISTNDLWTMFESTALEEIINYIDVLIYQDYTIYIQNGHLNYEHFTNVISADVATIVQYEGLVL